MIFHCDHCATEMKFTGEGPDLKLECERCGNYWTVDGKNDETLKELQRAEGN
jgi:hypothetical protein